MAIHIGLICRGNITKTHARAGRAICGLKISAIHGTNTEKIARLCANTAALPIKTSTPFCNIAPWNL